MIYHLKGNIGVTRISSIQRNDKRFRISNIFCHCTNIFRRPTKQKRYRNEDSRRNEGSRTKGIQRGEWKIVLIMLPLEQFRVQHNRFPKVPFPRSLRNSDRKCTRINLTRTTDSIPARETSTPSRKEERAISPRVRVTSNATLAAITDKIHAKNDFSR